MKRRKYSTGTSVKNYIEDPTTELYKNAINIQKAQVEGSMDPLASGLDVLGKLMMQGGANSFVNQGGFGSFEGIGKGAGSLFDGILSSGVNVATTLENGGVIGGIPVEVENNEVGETPQGDLMKFKGATHAQGGIDVDLPEGTEIFSDKLKVDGVSMADRKLKREKKESKLEKLLKKNSSDKPLKNTLERTVLANKMEEQDDMDMQKMITIMEALKKGKGNASKKRKKMTLGGPVSPLQENPYAYSDPLVEDELFQVDSSTGVDSDSDTDVNSNRFNLESLFGGINGGDNPLTVGDSVGIAGTLISTFGPLLNTKKNRAGDTPNINYFENFGEEGLATQTSAEGYVEDQKDRALQDLELAGTSAKRRTRNSARGINSQRAMDLATDQNINKAQGDIYNNTSNIMMKLLGQKAGMQNLRDQMKMTGEGQKDTADRQDRDAFFTNLSSNISDMGYGLQKSGGNLNEVKRRDVMQNLLNQLSAYGYYIDKKGNLKSSKKEEETG
ncbi:hypothetical protein N9933_01145 [bacterium]|nr:hypothetical protein [bacterium]